MAPSNFPKRSSLSCAHDQVGGLEGGEHPTSRPPRPLLINQRRPTANGKTRGKPSCGPTEECVEGFGASQREGPPHPAESPQRGACSGVCREGDSWLGREVHLAVRCIGGKPQTREIPFGSITWPKSLTEYQHGQRRGPVGVAGIKDALLPKADMLICPAEKHRLIVLRRSRIFTFGVVSKFGGQPAR